MTASVLTTAIRKKNWTLAALCLLLGVAEEAARLSPEAIERLLDLLEPEYGRRSR
jgi:hypothetical protein